MIVNKIILFLLAWSGFVQNRCFSLIQEIKFKSVALENEYIVKFNHFYWPQARAKFLHAALSRAKVSSWDIRKRVNPASEYPSDFDLLVVEEGNIDKNQVLLLILHPAIKTISPHRSVQRILSYRNNSDQSFVENVGRHLLRAVPSQIASAVQADALWKLGITGAGMKVAVFDTGLPSGHAHFRRVKERSNWTNEKTLDDGVSHGTFVAGVIASTKECRGIAPDVELHIYRVFTNSQVSYTSWFLDAFNYAIFRKINILNLSIGGPDFLDYPFVDKVLELSANKVIMVSAIGNDGPLYGTLNNPGDQSDVIGVGGINFEEKVARFSSRGMTTWELPEGYGRLKPDIMTYGSQVKGSDVNGGCRSLSGTSVASPVIAGAIALIASSAPHKMALLNPSSMKQILFEGASRLHDSNMFEQGYGKLNIMKSTEVFSAYVPKVTLSPAYLDFTETYMWPYSSQPLFCESMPVIANITILNGISVTGIIVEDPIWHPHEDKNGNLLNIAISYSSVLWPWSGWMSVHIVVNKHGCGFKGIAEGHISLTVESILKEESDTPIKSTIYFPMTILITPKPPRHKRILWDQYHNLRYPPGYIPRDNLKIKSDPLDWRADHIHTNFRDMYIHLRNSGYYVEILQAPYTCFNASDYGTLLLVDPEEEFFDDEISKIQTDVYDYGLGVIVFADWYNTTLMKKIKFFDENTRQWWIPDTGGSNIPALNELFKPFGIGFSDFVSEGYFKLGDHAMYIASGTTIAKCPQNVEDIVVGVNVNDQGAEMLGASNSFSKNKIFKPILGLFQTSYDLRKKFLKEDLNFLPTYEETFIQQPIFIEDIPGEKNPIVNKRILLSTYKTYVNISLKEENEQNFAEGIQSKPNLNLSGRIAVFSDSNCLDSTNLEKSCFWLLDAFLEFTMNSHKSGLLQKLNKNIEFNFTENKNLPLRLFSSNLHHHSKVLDSNDKFIKMATEKCKRLHWSEPVHINSSYYNQQLNTFKDMEVDIFKNKGKTLPNRKSDNGLKTYLRKENSIKLSLIFVFISSFVVLFLLMCYFWKKVCRTVL